MAQVTNAGGSRPRLLVTRSLFPEVLEHLSRHADVDRNADDEILTPAALRARAAGCAGVITCIGDNVDVIPIRNRMSNNTALFSLRGRSWPDPQQVVNI